MSFILKLLCACWVNWSPGTTLLCPAWQKGCNTGDAQSLTLASVEVAHPGERLVDGCWSTLNPGAAAGVRGRQAQLMTPDAPGFFSLQ